MNVAKILVRVSGWMYVDHKLTLEDDVTITLKGTVDEEKVKPNYEGSVDLHYVIKPNPARADVETI